VSGVDLNEAISRMADMIQGMLGERISLAMETEDFLWRISADAGAIDQIIINLAVNARDAMPDGGVFTLRTYNLSVKEHRDGLHAGRYVVMSVSDTGTGMDSQTLQHIFDPFFTTKEVGRGTGLGLSVVYGIVKQFDGVIQVNSQKGKGSTFTIHFPASLAAAFFLDGREKEDLQIKGAGEKVLLAEDEDMVRSVISEILLENNYQVLQARDGRTWRLLK